jgi:pyruvate dehydrogenase E2 component (dihydrolipoyllysine-residue acetyltransferase)
MPTDVVMPQMGESIAEGTIVRWIKKIGDPVERDEPLFEISTDKVDAEIPSPAAGVVTEIRAKEGETVPVNSVVAVIGAAERATSSMKAAPAAPPTTEPPRPKSAPANEAEAAKTLPSTQGHVRREPVAKPEGQSADAPSREPVASSSLEERIRQRSSPLVRKIAKEHDVDISQIRGTGIAGRVTKNDILGFIGGAGEPAPPSPAAAGQARPQPAARAERVEGKGTAGPAPAARQPSAGSASGAGLVGQVVPMSVMRKRIAEHMIASRRTSAHVHSVFEVNFGRVAQVRETKKAEYERAGAKLTYLSFILKAVVNALRAVPVVNASVDGDTIVYHQNINVGIAVALDWGLIVPVIKSADEKNLLGLSRAVADLATRARSKQLKPEEVTGGTFTITNPGVFGALFGMPIINQPQVAILGVGHIEKRPVVIDDAIAIRPMAYLSLGYDHRIVDGAVADEFMSHVKHELENWDPAQN